MTYTLEELAREQQSLLLDRFDYDFAWRFGVLMRERAAVAVLPIAITVAHGEDVVFSALMPGATSDNFDWAKRKRAVAWRFQRSSLAMRLEAEQKQLDFNQRYRLPEDRFTASGGGVPLILNGGTVIGTAAVSGLPDVEDHRLIVDAIRQMLAAVP